MPRIHPRKSRSFTFTRFCEDGNSWEEEDRLMREPMDNHQQVVYGVWNHEICPETNRRHLQGAIKLDGTRSFSWVQQHLFRRGEHVEFCRSWIASVKYCQKADSQAPETTFFQFGDVSESSHDKDGAFFIDTNSAWNSRLLVAHK